MQDTILGQLKGVLKSNEEKLHIKDLQVEGYALRLGKTRTRRSPGPHPSTHSQSSTGTMPHLPSPIFDTQSESGLELTRQSPLGGMVMTDSFCAGESNVTISTSSSTYHKIPQVIGGGGTIGQLRQQLNEIRAKENEEDKSRQVLEGMVRQLQEELAERDHVIKDMKDDMMSVASFAYTASPFVMSPEGGSSPTAVSPSRSPPLGCSLDSAASFDFAAAARPFDDKDNRILELNEQVILLERRILDLEENLHEKDELILARTRAVTLMSADLSAKGKLFS